jgi:hypothetical protein
MHAALTVIPDVGSNLFHVGHGRLVAGKNIVCAILLVGRNEVGIVDAWQGLHERHFLVDQSFQRWFQNLSTIHGRGDVQAADVPPSNHDVVGMDHGQDIVERNVDLFVGRCVASELDGRTHNDRAVVVGRLTTFLGVPNEPTSVGDDSRSDGGAVVAAPADQHHANLGHFPVNLEVIRGFLWGCREFAVGRLGDGGGPVDIFALDVVVGVDHVGRVDREEFLGRLSRVGGLVSAIPVHGADAYFRVWCHIDWRDLAE